MAENFEDIEDLQWEVLCGWDEETKEKEYLGLLITGQEHRLIRKKFLVDYGVKKEHFIKTVTLPHIDLLDVLLKMEGVENFDRVVVYSIHDFSNAEEFLTLYQICQDYYLQWTVIKENIHSEDFYNEKEFKKFINF